MKLSLNTATIKRATLAEAARLCADNGIDGIGPWRDVVEAAGGAVAARKLLDGYGLTVTSLCRGGFVTSGSPESLEDNRRAIEEAAELGTGELVLVVGGLAEGSKDLPGARANVARALALLVPYARERGVRLAIEPLHPMFCADRAVVSTLGQALDLAEPFAPDEVGVVVDTYHVWWDPQLFAQIARAAGRISAYQVCDWVVPLPADMLLGRGHVGDGHIEFAPITAAVLAAGYTGHVEVEIFNQSVWDTDPAQTVRTMVERHHEHIAV
ncbi:sugar phosphate isomerase/epimerase family protein [Catellatospora tritici]|uniref:sugar phosphate isomerase/epimerase family protein n=1 Tax=Catellatospora tritici TaxID=2851566 RepID=UPI001C2DB545|nr:sugar phosphate isomerase/epimerase [Catellatospora tritici]MBV1855701.1 sugar phosphate isomerase/epimerase [Catellatospora tritici]